VVAAGEVGVAEMRISCPQCGQKADSRDTSDRQDGQERVNGCATVAGAFNAVPQCIQNAAPGFTSPLQRGQVLVDAS